MQKKGEESCVWFVPVAWRLMLTYSLIILSNPNATILVGRSCLGSLSRR